MKKTFKLSHPKIKYPRMVESAKHEAKKYLKRERNKALPEGADFWDFDCKYGASAADAQVIHVSEINQYISQAEAEQLESFYLEILAKPAKRTPRPETEDEHADDDGEDTDAKAQSSASEKSDTEQEWDILDPWEDD